MQTNLVLWQDKHLVVVNKPAGLPSLPDGYHPEAPFLKSLLEADFGRLWTVHRLDRETSGVVVLARNAAAHRHLNSQFESRQVEKTYHALVLGNSTWERCEVNLPLRVNADRRHRTRVDEEDGKPAHTSLQVLERLVGHMLLAVQPHTGRTHQIRAHLAALGFPILADELYGGGKRFPQVRSGVLERAGLHAYSLAFDHPISGVRLSFTAPHPQDLAEALALLRARLSTANGDN